MSWWSPAGSKSCVGCPAVPSGRRRRRPGTRAAPAACGCRARRSRYGRGSDAKSVVRSGSPVVVSGAPSSPAASDPEAASRSRSGASASRPVENGWSLGGGVGDAATDRSPAAPIRRTTRRRPGAGCPGRRRPRGSAAQSRRSGPPQGRTRRRGPVVFETWADCNRGWHGASGGTSSTRLSRQSTSPGNGPHGRPAVICGHHTPASWRLRRWRSSVAKETTVRPARPCRR